MFSNSVQLHAKFKKSVFFTVSSKYSNVYMCHIFFTHSSVEGHLGCFQVLAVTNNGALNIVEQMLL